MTIKGFLFALGPTLALVVALGAPAPASSDEPDPATLTVTAEGEIAVVPDMAVVRAGVETDGPTAAAALEANNMRMTAVLEALRGLGIDERDLRTGRVALNPVYESRTRAEPAGPPRIAAYRAVNEVVVRVRDIARTGEVLDRAVAAGAGRLGGVAFTLEDPTPATDEARRRAVAEARRRAALYAEAAGVRLTRILSISEAGGVRPRPVAPMAMRAEAQGMPIEPGEMTVRATVTIVWEIEGS